ncbi:MAG: hypothetical protein MR028_03195 [Ligilactobacillus agilis]|uniref:hypothetical protein n=1 Tax=Ligilactobacillus agilis TaxID=1601 RepID=UPI00242E5491|nr:hypothetical protein [Ligilactobacillus agilis]MCI5761415.1 hypothetical protein [Ligilactobacillus agilis]
MLFDLKFNEFDLEEYYINNPTVQLNNKELEILEILKQKSFKNFYKGEIHHEFKWRITYTLEDANDMWERKEITDDELFHITKALIDQRFNQSKIDDELNIGVNRNPIVRKKIIQLNPREYRILKKLDFELKQDAQTINKICNTNIMRDKDRWTLLTVLINGCFDYDTDQRYYLHILPDREDGYLNVYPDDEDEFLLITENDRMFLDTKEWDSFAATEFDKLEIEFLQYRLPHINLTNCMEKVTEE